MKAMIKNAIICGGIHGNELTGVYLIKHWQKNPEILKRSHFNTHTIIGNPRAVQNNSRFVDSDLNGCFKRKLKLNHYESHRAKEIEKFILAKGNIENTAVFDLHTTTSHMGITLILTDPNPWNFACVQYVKSKIDDVNIYTYFTDEPSGHLNCLTRLGLTVEIGPVFNSTLDSFAFFKTQEIIQHCLDFIELSHKIQIEYYLEGQLETYQQTGSILYPLDKDGELNCFIHPHFLKRNFKLLKEGEPLFKTFNGKDILYSGTETYPVFIGETSFYKKTACLTTMQKLISINR